MPHTIESLKKELNVDSLQELDLRWAKLQGSKLQMADFHMADFRGADLRGADLRWAYLRGADLRGADLQWADLRGADLRWSLINASTRGIVCQSNLGRENRTLYCFQFDDVFYFHTGCFKGNEGKFKEAILKTHGFNGHAIRYFLAIRKLKEELKENIKD